MRETCVWSLDREDPLEREMATHSNIFAGKSHGQGSLPGYSPWGRRVDPTERLHFHFISYISLEGNQNLLQGRTIVSWLFLPCFCTPSLISNYLNCPLELKGSPGGWMKLTLKARKWEGEGSVCTEKLLCPGVPGSCSFSRWESLLLSGITGQESLWAIFLVDA